MHGIHVKRCGFKNFASKLGDSYIIPLCILLHPRRNFRGLGHHDHRNAIKRFPIFFCLLHVALRQWITTVVLRFHHIFFTGSGATHYVSATAIFRRNLLPHAAGFYRAGLFKCCGDLLLECFTFAVIGLKNLRSFPLSSCSLAGFSSSDLQ